MKCLLTGFKNRALVADVSVLSSRFHFLILLNPFQCIKHTNSSSSTSSTLNLPFYYLFLMKLFRSMWPIQLAFLFLYYLNCFQTLIRLFQDLFSGNCFFPVKYKIFLHNHISKLSRFLNSLFLIDHVSVPYISSFKT